jgi:hypothetical protein
MAASHPPPKVAESRERLSLEHLETSTIIAEVAGPGRWLVIRYAPVALFSLKASFATSSVGRSLVVPTPYAIKMAFVDAAFRTRLSDAACDEFLRSLVGIDIRVSPPSRAVVTHTFVKVRQEPKVSKPNEPYIAAISYRDFVAHKGQWLWAFDLVGCDAETAARLVDLAPCIRYVGKRGSFVQYVGVERRVAVDKHFTWPVGDGMPVLATCHFVQLDDFGPDADLGILSSFTQTKAKRDKHRRFVSTMVPVGIVATGPGFTEYG